ncbi:MAG: class II aldolase/adducin family protein [Mogibacterium sp.]|uniref:class II aldolase/adducin family protein n=1 Tax=Mogibacterium sp. TaxID=2049035 RepID=UPI001A57DCBE|nr:class II aldolase/adducin family protein [Mogibacterium sp.]MBL6469161.1 class II aldolase/adducin family protein [Mogibacterium sp.]
MDINTAKEALLKRSNAFRERYFTAYGQLVLRVNEETYISSRENLRLSKLTEKDFELFDINTGDIGRIFSSRDDINAIVFICTEAAVRFSKENQIMWPALDDLAQIIGPDVTVCPDGTARTLLKALRNRRGCFIQGSGIIAVGETIEEAIAGARILEKSAEAEIYSGRLNGLQYLDPAAAQELHKYYDGSYSKVNQKEKVDFISSGAEEFRLRNRIIDCGKDMSRSELVQGSWGNISLRLNPDTMLITPSGMDYFSIRTEDIVRMNIHDLKYGMQRKPSSEFRLHAALYRRYPECNAIIHTHSNGISAFAAAHAGFRISEPPMDRLIGDMHCSEYQTPGTDELCDSIMDAIEGSHACIIANHGAIFYGNDLDVTLAIANAVESRACNLLGFGQRPDTEEE